LRAEERSTRLFTLRIAKSAGHSQTCALPSDGAVKCWGSNAFGQLGVGDELDRGDHPDEMGDHLPAVDLGAGKTAMAIAAGGCPTCALRNDGAVKYWGNNARMVDSGPSAHSRATPPTKRSRPPASFRGR
jgi:hypothetical protein